MGLTIYAIFTKSDFTMMWGVIWILFMSFLVFGIFTGIGFSYWLYNLYCVFGVILFGIYIIFDTQMIIGGKRLQLSMDDYVIGALILYIDIIQMFLYLLSLFGRRWNSTITWLSFKPKIDIFIKLINLFILYRFHVLFDESRFIFNQFYLSMLDI